MKQKRLTVLQLSHDAARDFFLKGESYCNYDLPSYFQFDPVLEKVGNILAGNGLKGFQNSNPRDLDDLNHTILSNKDGRFAWRPYQLTHPALYVALAQLITEPNNWSFLTSRFKRFKQNPKIKCLSLPVESLTNQKDKAEQILKWWQEVEQRSVELSLDFEFLAHTDITDCYGSIYTHSVPWALHKKSKGKLQRKDKTLLGNKIDWLLQDMNHGQTNGIPQGSVLMDFVAEMVLGYADILLSKKIKEFGISDYRILRYRDDYRIFVNNLTDGEEIVKLISEVMYELGMKLSPSKTKFSRNVIEESIKADKLDWIKRKKSDLDLQKHLLLIHDFASTQSNSGSLIRSLVVFHRRVLKAKNPREVVPLIAIVTDIAFHNPKAYAITSAILSKLVDSIPSKIRRLQVLKRINKRF